MNAPFLTLEHVNVHLVVLAVHAKQELMKSKIRAVEGTQFVEASP